MTKIERKGNVLTIVRVASYDETCSVNYWYLVIELKAVRKTIKSATKMANKHLKTLPPTEAYLQKQKELMPVETPKKKKDKKKKKKVFTIGIN